MTETEALVEHTTAADAVGIMYTTSQVMEFGYI